MKPINCLVTATVAVALAVPVQAQVDCANWNTRDFFKAAEVSDVIRCLEAGADPNERADGGWTPLYFAGSAEAVTALLEAGADPMARSLHGGTPLHWATTNEAVTALLQAGANLEARNENGLTPLHWATTSEAVTALLQAGANLEARDEYRGTPLHRAAELSKNPEVIKVMLDAGADTAARNAAGKTPWDLVQVNDALKGSDAYWRLNDARFKSSDSVFRIGGDVSAPRLTYKVEPEYSEEAAKQSIKEQSFWLSRFGRTVEPTIFGSSEASGSGWTKRRSRRSRSGSSCPARKTGFQSRSAPTSKLTFDYCRSHLPILVRVRGPERTRQWRLHPAACGTLSASTRQTTQRFRPWK